MLPPVGLSRPPMRFSSVVLPDPDGPISARNSPCGMSRLTPCSTSMRSDPRLKCLWTSRTLTSEFNAIVLSPVVEPASPVLADPDLHPIGELRRRRDDDALAGGQPGQNLDPVAVHTAS